MQSKFNLKLFGLVVAISLTGAADAQTWNYQGSQHQDAAGPATMGRITLLESGGEYTFQLQATNPDPCYRTSLKASVIRTPATITITPVPVVAGCGQERFVLKTDGTGGSREFLTDGKWRREDANRVLTLRK